MKDLKATKLLNNSRVIRNKFFLNLTINLLIAIKRHSRIEMVNKMIVLK